MTQHEIDLCVCLAFAGGLALGLIIHSLTASELRARIKRNEYFLTHMQHEVAIKSELCHALLEKLSAGEKENE